MAHQPQCTPLLRKTRIVCISDTHTQTPKLPKGDVLIHAGDLTNQGSYSELKKIAEWLEKADFEAKIVVAGNHDITLDAAFYEEHGSSWRWPKPQDPEKCRKLFEDSESITYLEHEAAAVYLSSPSGPHTCFKVFGSPYSPNHRNWAFKYLPENASGFWDDIPSDADIVISHTPPKGHGDAARTSDRSGCEVLLESLYRVRPMLSVFGHIHEARGLSRVLWNDTPENGCLEEGVEAWEDPGIGKKQSLVNLSAKGGRPLNNCSGLTRCSTALSLTGDAPSSHWGRQTIQPQPEPDVLQPSNPKSTSRFEGTEGTEGVTDSEATAKAMSGGAIVYRQAARTGDIGLRALPDVEDSERRRVRRETAMINAAYLGPREHGVSKTFNKPIVVDVDLPVWQHV